MKLYTDKNEVTTEHLLQLINNKRKIMLATAEKYGTDSGNTLKCSQELDALILNYQRLIKFERTNTT